MGPGDLYDLAAELRDICAEALDSIPEHPGMDDLDGAPAYAFVSDAAPIPECCDDGMLAVHVNNVTDRFARAAEPSAPKLNVPSLIVSLLRCVPVGTGEGDHYEPPTVDEIQTSARQTLADGWALWNGIYSAIEQEVFLTRCRRAEFVSMQSVRPGEGQCAGWQLAFLVQLDGYSLEFAT